MIFKYTKCESVIAKIMADADMSEKNIRVTDIREWIFEAVEKIGAPVQYVQKESGDDCVPVFEIHENQIPIPDDLESLTSVAYSVDGTNWMQARKDESSFKLKANAHKNPSYTPQASKSPTTFSKPHSHSPLRKQRTACPPSKPSWSLPLLTIPSKSKRGGNHYDYAKTAESIHCW